MWKNSILREKYRIFYVPEHRKSDKHGSLTIFIAFTSTAEDGTWTHSSFVNPICRKASSILLSRRCSITCSDTFIFRWKLNKEDILKWNKGDSDIKSLDLLFSLIWTLQALNFAFSLSDFINTQCFCESRTPRATVPNRAVGWLGERPLSICIAIKIHLCYQ